MAARDAPGSATNAERFAWCLFDFANSAFNTIVLTFVYGQFFSRVLVGNQKDGDVLWARALTVAGVVIALISPVLGAMADRSAHKRLYLVVSAAAVVGCTLLLFLPRPDPALGRAGDAAVVAALVLVAVATVAFEVMFVFYNAFLPGLAPAQGLGRLSGYGWAFGYGGGLLCLALCLLVVGGTGSGPWLPSDGYLNVRATNLIVAAWFALFALPMFVLVRDRTAPAPATAPPARGAIGQSLRQVGRTLRALPAHPDLLRFLLARLFYNDATVALIQFSGLYMADTLGMATEEILVLGIVLNVVAGLGALVFGFVDDWLGAKPALIASLLLLIGGCALALGVPTRGAFTAAAVLVGLGLGPSQAASRTLLARFVAPARAAEFYGLFELSGKAGVWLGPLLFALVRERTDEQRVAFLPLLALFALGLVLLLTVDERRGVERGRSMG